MWDLIQKEVDENKKRIEYLKNPPSPFFVQRNLEMYAKKKSGNSWFIICPFHGDKDASLSVIVSSTHRLPVGFWRCFGCGQEGFWDDLADVLHLPTLDPLKQDLHESEIFKFQEVEDEPIESFNYDALNKWPTDKKWRGFKGDFLLNYGACYDKKDNKYSLVFLCRHRNKRKVIGYIRCRKKASDLSYINAKGAWASKYWFMEEYITHAKTILIVEGLRDVLAWNKLGIPTIGLLGTQSGAKRKRRNTLLGMGVEHTVLFCDNDEAGRIAVEGNGTKEGLLATLGIDFKVTVFPTWKYFVKKEVGKVDPFMLAKRKDFVKKFKKHILKTR